MCNWEKTNIVQPQQAHESRANDQRHWKLVEAEAYSLFLKWRPLKQPRHRIRVRVCSLREEVTELMKVAKFTRITILVPTCRFFWCHHWCWLLIPCVHLYTRPTLVFPQGTECQGIEVMGYVTLGELCHRNASIQSFTASSESFLSNAIFRTPTLSRAHKCICSCGQC